MSDVDRSPSAPLHPDPSRPEAPRLDAPYLEAWKGLLRAHDRVVSSIEARLAAADCIPLTSYDVLLELRSAPDDRLRMADLADRVLLSRSGLTRHVDRLERDGMIRRESAESDRRGTVAVLTPAGRAALRRAWPVYAEGIAAEFAAALEPDEAATIAAALTRVAAGADDDA